VGEIDGEDLEGKTYWLTQLVNSIVSAVRAFCKYVTVRGSLAADLVDLLSQDQQDQDPDDGVE